MTDRGNENTWWRTSEPRWVSTMLEYGTGEKSIVLKRTFQRRPMVGRVSKSVRNFSGYKASEWKIRGKGQSIGENWKKEKWLPPSVMQYISTPQNISTPQHYNGCRTALRHGPVRAPDIALRIWPSFLSYCFEGVIYGGFFFFLVNQAWQEIK